MNLAIKGKVCIITGSNAGIGKQTAKGLAASGARVIMVCRSEERGEAARVELINETGSDQVDLMLADLASQSSIRNLVNKINKEYDQVNVLINNAANFDHRLTEPVLTDDGIETVFATNHLAPFLMTNLLLDKMMESQPSRVLNVASMGLITYPRLDIEFENLNGEMKYSLQHAYYHSKLAQIIFTYELARRLNGTGVTANCIRVPNVQVDKGRYEYIKGIKLRLYEIKRRFGITPEEMAKTYIYLATSPELEKTSGKYFDQNCNAVKSNKNSYNQATWLKLWEVSCELIGLDRTV